MDKEIKIILVLIVFLVGVVLGLVLIVDTTEKGAHVVIEKDFDGLKNNKKFIDSSSWLIYTSDEYAYEIKYPFEWEFNLTDGTTFHPELCARNKYDKCVGRVSVGVYPDIDENDEVLDLQKKCSSIKKVTLRHINSDVWMCEEFMSDDFAVAQGYNRKREYYFKDNRGSVFEIDIMYIKGDGVQTEEEIIQTIKLKAK